MKPFYIGLGWHYLLSERALRFSLVFFVALLLAVVTFVDGFVNSNQFFNFDRNAIFKKPFDRHLDPYEAAFRIGANFFTALFLFFMFFYFIANGWFDYDGYKSLHPDLFVSWYMVGGFAAMIMLMGAYCRYFFHMLMFVGKIAIK